VCVCDIQSMSSACLFLAAKIEEQPRKLEHVIRTRYAITNREQQQPPQQQQPLDIKSDVSTAGLFCISQTNSC